jgi:hypothetical protein
MVDWRGRWIDDEEYDEEEDIDEDDRLMEDFDAVGIYIYILRAKIYSLMQAGLYFFFRKLLKTMKKRRRKRRKKRKRKEARGST